MAHTVVGLFSTNAQAEQVKQQLVTEGFDASDIKVLANDASETAGSYQAGTSASGTTEEKEVTEGKGIGHTISNFFSSLTGGDEDVHNHYATGVNQGGALLAVRVDDQQEALEVASLLRQHGAREIEGEDSGATRTGSAYTGSAAASSTVGETAIPIVEEQLEVGKREVDRGGVRIYSHLVETPVDTDVTLREERINLERRPVSRPATAADFETGRNAVIELNATGEEAVVGKSARVVEEVLVGKESSTRTQAIHDSVRKTEVDVEEFAGAGTVPGGTTYDRDRS